jgi:hypothetical protein
MKYENIKRYKPEEFRRLTGVKPATFAVMGLSQKRGSLFFKVMQQV